MLRYEDLRVRIHKHAPTYSEIDLHVLPFAVQVPRKMRAGDDTGAK